MRRQRNMAQMKEQIKTPEKELNEMEISNLSYAEFKILLVRILKELSEDLNSIKRSSQKQRILKLKLRTIYRETMVEWMKPRIKSMIWNIRKQKTTTQNNKN